ncbi:MAG: hypothetical protein PHT38_04710 [Halothiobacillus sp.]|nr:hypothetical protein [Halothiobacillus sp.]
MTQAQPKAMTPSYDTSRSDRQQSADKKTESPMTPMTKTMTLSHKKAQKKATQGGFGLVFGFDLIN